MLHLKAHKKRDTKFLENDDQKIFQEQIRDRPNEYFVIYHSS